MIFMHWMQAQWPHGITAVSHGLVQQTGQFVDDAAAVVDKLVAVADFVLLVVKWSVVLQSALNTSQSNLTSRGYWNLLSGFWFIGEMAIGLMVYRGFYFRAFDLSGILQSGFWFIGEFVIGVLTYRGFVIGLMVIGLLAIGLMSCSRIIDWDCLRAKWKIRWEPIKRQTIKTEPILKTSKKDGMINSIKGSG